MANFVGVDAFTPIKRIYWLNIGAVGITELTFRYRQTYGERKREREMEREKKNCTLFIHNFRRELMPYNCFNYSK